MRAVEVLGPSIMHPAKWSLCGGGWVGGPRCALAMGAHNPTSQTRVPNKVTPRSIHTPMVAACPTQV